jgi:hypothetical protein
MDLIHRRLHFRTTWTPSFPTSSGAVSPLAWWDANTLTGLSDGDAVQYWTDRVSGTYTTNQTEAARRPTYKTNIINGNPAILFTSSSTQRLPFTSIVGKSYTIAAVVKLSDNSVNRLILCGGGTGSLNIQFGMATANKITSYLPESTATSDTCYTAWNTNKAVMLNRLSNTTVKFFENGYTRSANLTVPNVNGSFGMIGCLYLLGSYYDYFNGYIAEIIVYSSSLSSSDSYQVNAYLCNKYGITILGA